METDGFRFAGITRDFVYFLNQTTINVARDLSRPQDRGRRADAKLQSQSSAVEHKNERGRASGYRSAFATRSSVASLDCSCIIKSSASQIDRVRDTA